MDIEHKTVKKRRLVRVSGELSIYEVKALQTALVEELAVAKDFTLDLTQASACDTACVQTICSAIKTAEETKVEMKILPSEPVNKAFDSCSIPLVI